MFLVANPCHTILFWSYAFEIKLKVAASEDLLWPSDSDRRSGRFEANLGSAHAGHVGESFLLI